jgi:protein-S-isoprenylcysteine O-methyltransferase Ste14
MILFENTNIWSLLTGLLIVVTGELIRLWGVSWAGSETRTTDRAGGTFLIISGPFAYVRNPLYVGNILIYTGLGIMSFALFPYLQIIGFFFFFYQYNLIIKEEEKYLRETFREEYEKYFNNVPRFFPKFIPYKSDKIMQPQFKLSAGLRSEKRSLQAIGFVSLTIFLLWFIGRM